MIKSYLKSLRFLLTTIRYSFGSSKSARRFVHSDVPYFSQWESPELVAQILNGVIKAEDDPKWRGSGASSKAEYAAWSWAGCGMACLKMILAHHNKVTIPLVTLGQTCAQYGGYDTPLEQSVGLKYAPFVTFVKAEFGLSAKAVPALPLMQIVSELARGNYVIASVSPAIRDVMSRPTTKGGHLVVILGYDLDKQEFYLHNPSGNSVESQKYAKVSFKDFKKFFGMQGIVVKK